MATLNAGARAVLDSAHLAHLVTLTPSGSPQVSLVWVGLDGDEIVSGHLDGRLQKLVNIRRDPRVAMSIETGVTNDYGLGEYLVVHGYARITEGGAPELLHDLAQTYIGPGTKFPTMPDPPPGFIVHIRVTGIGGIGPWKD